MPATTLTDDQLFEGFDRVAIRLGVKPPNTPAEQIVTAGMLKWFFIGARWHQHVLEHQESSSDQFALPGIDFDSTEVMAELTERTRSKNQRKNQRKKRR